MRNTTIDIVMINMSNYTEWLHGVSNRNYHVLKGLASSDEVGKIIAVDYPPLTLKRAIRNYKENILSKIPDSTVVSRTLADKLTRISDRLYVYSNCDFFVRPESIVRKLRSHALDLNFGDFIVWSYFPPIMPYLRSIGQKLLVFDAVDNWIEHPSYTRKRDMLKASYKFIKASADVIFTVADELQTLFDSQSNVYWIPNGVDLAHYTEPATLINRDIADLPRPIIGYIGIVQERVDVDLILYLAMKNPGKTFVVAGPVWRAEDEKKFMALPNLHLLGYKRYDEAPQYIQQFDVGIIPHKPSPFITSTNPMKLYEYLACGKPVVATRGAGVEAFKDVVYIADTREDFNRKLFIALQEDSTERRAERLNAVRPHSWSTIVAQMLEIIQNKLV